MLNIHASFGGADFYPIIESYSPTMRKHAVFRKDIQALRAISALTIMICHIWLNRVSGGVDVFFVISGYFMAATLFKLEHKNGINATQYSGKKFSSKSSQLHF